MPLVNMQRWLAEHGGSPAMPDSAPAVEEPAALDPSVVSHIQALEAEIARQAILIRQLQDALRTVTMRERQVAVAKLQGPKRAPVIRKPRVAVPQGAATPETPERK